jgi:hypothetical protein
VPITSEVTSTCVEGGIDMITIEAPIEAVTVYTDRALVTRRGRVTLEAGEQQVVLPNLPLRLVPASVRAAGRGTVPARILGVDVAKTFHAEPPHVAVARLEAQIKPLEEEDQALADKEAAIDARLEFLKGLGAAAQEQMAKGLAFGKATLQDGTELASFLSQGLEAASAERRQVAKRRGEIAKELEALRQQFKQLQVSKAQEAHQIAVSIEADGPGEMELEMSYAVSGASWEPLYDLRLDEEGDEPQATVTYLGQVAQQSGESWNGVRLTLSTARPALSAVMPELKPWYVMVFTPLEEEVSFAAAVLAEAEVEEVGAVLTFAVARPARIPGDGSPHKVPISVLEPPASLDYVSAPKLVSAAYRRATITNLGLHILLPGQVNIFHGPEYVGSTRIKTVGPRERFEVYLGVDERIKVERELVGQRVDKQFLGNNRRLRYAYDITVENLKRSAEQVTVMDQIPVSRHEEIKVKGVVTEPEPTERSDLGLVKWTFVVEGGGKRTLHLAFTVEHPRERQVIGLPG